MLSFPLEFNTYLAQMHVYLLPMLANQVQNIVTPNFQTK